MSAITDVERMRNINYREGKAILEDRPESNQLYHRLLEECPHVDDKAIVSLFRLGNEELILATAHRLEYNATHPPENGRN